MITEAQLRAISQRYSGQGVRFAFLELAQEHLLHWMVQEGMFDGTPEDVVFKGGTAIRKFRLGMRGRFSTDLDFAISDDAYASHVLLSLQEGLVDVEGVTFRATDVDVPAAKGRWIATVAGIGDTIEAKIEFTRRATMLPPTIPTERAPIPGISPELLGFELPMVPLMRLEENLAEKLARFRRVIRSRDLYDLSALGREVRDQLPLIRQILCFKVYFDIVRDGRASAVPFLAGPEFAGRTEPEIVDPDDLGLIMGGGVDYGAMLGTVGAMFGPMGPPAGDLEERLAAVNPADLWWAEQQYETLRAIHRSDQAGAGS